MEWQAKSRLKFFGFNLLLGFNSVDLLPESSPIYPTPAIIELNLVSSPRRISRRFISTPLYAYATSNSTRRYIWLSCGKFSSIRTHLVLTIVTLGSNVIWVPVN
ncbi:hypothetical protein C8F04DRAFT_260258 [Mycena alexandri]|uniref:Uncharacterized protein n=1 Tax=Mycena alexandri TaxID=1745969 RepID=A0AAD6WUQ8_9AGAR|nr:hypothetical protein C8F04DRAFT_260258 [Mycena alexandri]